MSAHLVELVTWTLAHSLWQASAVAILLAIVLAALGPRRAGARYVSAAGALFLQAALPIATFVWLATRPEADPLPSLVAAAGEPSLVVWIASLWSAGAAVMALRLGAGLFEVRRMLRRSEPHSPDWTRRLEALRERFGVERRIRWLVSRSIDVPVTVGCLRPIVILPLTALTGLPVQQLELLVGHELLHVRRWDYLVNLLQSCVEVALFFHPAVWWVSSRMRAEREACCDDGVVRAGADPLVYARALAALEQHRAQPGELVLASSGGALMWRIQRLLQPGRGARSMASGWGLLAAAAVVVLAGAVVAAVPSARVSSAWFPPALERHRAVIERAAAKHGVDADLLAVLVLAESAGDERAVSPLGARGLMQLLPKTAEQVAKRRGTAFSVEQLDDPAVNLELGAQYLVEQLARFKDAEDPIALAIAAYNGGPERVQAWRDGEAQLSTETQNYQQLVLGMWRERTAARSSAFEAWRERVRARRAGRAIAPVSRSKVSLAFGPQKHPFNGEPYQHTGVDLAAASGTPIVAPLDATVTDVTMDAERGTVVVLQHAGGMQTRYHHLGTVGVKPDQQVRRGEPFATVGATGKVTGPHVHFEVLDLGQPIDPAAFVGK